MAEDNEGYFNFIFSADTTGFNKAIDESIQKVNKAERDAERARGTTGEGTVKKKLSQQLKKLMEEEFKSKGKLVEAEKRLNTLLERRKRIEGVLERKDISKQKRAAVHLANARNEARILGIQARLAQKKAKAQRRGGGGGGGMRGIGGGLARGGLQGLGRIPGLGGIAGLAGMGGGMAAMGPAAAALAGAAVVGGVGAGTMSMVGEATGRRARSAGIGVDVESLHMFELAAEQTGLSLGSLDSALQHFKLATDEATKGDQKYVSILEKMGVTVEDVTKKGVTQSFLDMTAAMKDTEDAQRTLYDATKLVGSAAAELVPAAMRDFAQAAEDAKDLGRVLSNEQQDSMAEAADAWASLWVEVKTLFAPLAVWFAKTFKDALYAVQDFGFEMEALGAKIGIWGFGAGESWEEAERMGNDLLASRRRGAASERERRERGARGGFTPGMLSKDRSIRGMEARAGMPSADALQRIGIFVGPQIPKQQLEQLKLIKQAIDANKIKTAELLWDIRDGI
jgi:hypothetical protein